MDKNYCIQAENISRSFETGDSTIEVIRNVSLDVHKGEGVALTGPSGSGKTTLLCILSGMDMPTKGKMWLDGFEISAKREKRSQRFAIRRLA